MNNEQAFGQRRRGEPLLEHPTQVLDIGEIVLEFAVKIVLHRVCRSHVFSIGEEQANGTELSRCDRASEASEEAVGWSEMLGGFGNWLSRICS